MRTGIFVYALNLCRPMTGIGRYLVDLSKVDRGRLVAAVPNKKIVLESSFDHFNFPFFPAGSRLKKLLWSAFFGFNEERKLHLTQPIPLFCKGKNKILLTVHDTLFLEMPAYYSRIDRLYNYFALLISLRKSDRIICVSNYTKYSLMSRFPSLLDKEIGVVYNPVKINATSTKEKRLFDFGYFLSVSNRQPRKNLKTTIDGFLMSEAARNGIKLVLIGTSDGVDEYIADDRIVDLGYVDDHTLSSLYMFSDGLLFFSLGEGFGYPILEAASFGVPVFAANNTSISELFDYRGDLMCQEYITSEGISEFLNRFYQAPWFKSEVIKVLRQKLKDCSPDEFNKQMSDIYSNL